jgi:hypothetical protein
MRLNDLIESADVFTLSATCSHYALQVCFSTAEEHSVISIDSMLRYIFRQRDHFLAFCTRKRSRFALILTLSRN